MKKSKIVFSGVMATVLSIVGANAAQIASTQYVDRATGDVDLLTTTAENLTAAVNEINAKVVDNTGVAAAISAAIAADNTRDDAAYDVAGAAAAALTAAQQYADANDADTVYNDTAVRGLIDGKADKATTLAGYGITDGLTSADISNKADRATTLAGYGITDGLTATAADAAYDIKGAAAAALVDAQAYADANDADTVYDDTAVRGLIAGKQNQLTAGANVTIAEDGTISATDTNTVYDDTELAGRVTATEGVANAAKSVTDQIGDQGTIAKANAAIPAPPVECATQQCVLSSNASGVMTWDVVAL